MLELFIHQWKQFRRSGSFGREIGLTIFMGLLAVIGLLSILALSTKLSSIIPQISYKAAENPVLFFNSFLVYYFLIELLLRYFLQNAPVLDIQPYLNLPIKKSTTIRFLLVKSLLHPINSLAFIIVIPFGLDVILPAFGALATLTWVTSVFAISLSMQFINILFKKKLEENIWVWIIIITAVALNYVSSIYTSIDVTQYSGAFLTKTIDQPFWVIIPAFVLLSLFWITYKMFISNLYVEDLLNSRNAKSENYSNKLSFLSNYGMSGHLILEEIRMIIRHKRTRSVLILSIIFLGYGMIFFNGSSKPLKGMQLFASIFISGIFAINYGQFIWSWNTNQLSFFFTKPFAIAEWVKSKYQLITIATVASSILAIPYVYFGWEILVGILVASLYNLGINIPLMVRLALWGPKPIDLNKGAFMNYQGTGAAQWIMGLPILLGPFIFYTPFYFIAGHLAGLAAVGVTGLIGLLFRKYFIQKTATKLQSLKYQLIHELTI